MRFTSPLDKLKNSYNSNKSLDGKVISSSCEEITIEVFNTVGLVLGCGRGQNLSDAQNLCTLRVLFYNDDFHLFIEINQ